MDIWITWCRKVSTCVSCGKPIPTASPMVKGKVWRKKGSTEAAMWSYYLRWHPNCWMEAGLLYLKMNPYVKQHGKAKLDISPEMHELRTKLLQRRARLIYNLRSMSSTGATEQAIMRQIGKLLNLDELMRATGELPKKWSDPDYIANLLIAEGEE